jgi:tyrosine-protein kinase Etk/Wzc
MALGSIPTTGTQLARLIREAKIQETIFTLLTQQLEQAKIAEAKDTPTVRILDRAVPPEWKSRPSVLRNTIVAGILCLVGGVILAIVIEGVRRPVTR